MDYVKSLFEDNSRVKDVTFGGMSARVHFISHSAARKTLETFKAWEQYDVHWMSVDGTLQGDAAYGPILQMKNAKKELELSLIHI